MYRSLTPALLLGTFSALCQAAPPGYTMQIIADIPGGAGPTGLDSHGNAVGGHSTGDPSAAWSYWNGVYTPLAALPGHTRVSVFAMNDFGIAAGISKNSVSKDIVKFNLSSGVTESVASLSVAFSAPNYLPQAVSQSGRIYANKYTSSGDFMSCGYFESGAFVEIPELAGHIFSSITDDGTICAVRNSDLRAVTFANGVVTPLGLSPNGTPLELGASSRNGTISGYFFGPESKYHAFTKKGSVFQDLGVIPFPLSSNQPIYPRQDGVNNAGQVVGRFRPAGSEDSLYVIDQGTWYDVRSLIITPPAPQVIFPDMAYQGINDAGQILVQVNITGNLRAAILTPVPEPCGACVLAFSAVSLFRRRSKFRRSTVSQTS